jgi:hypothetical protein
MAVMTFFLCRVFDPYVITRTSLRGSEVRVVIKTTLVQNTASITGRACNGGSIGFSQWALWEDTVDKHSRRRIRHDVF